MPLVNPKRKKTVPAWKKAKVSRLTPHPVCLLLGLRSAAPCSLSKSSPISAAENVTVPALPWFSLQTIYYNVSCVSCSAPLRPPAEHSALIP